MKYIVGTDYGTFRVEIKDDTKENLQTRTKYRVGDTLSVGGKDICVFISIPEIGNTAKLHNLKTQNANCDIANTKISGKNTVGMVNLAFTIIRLLYPTIRFIELDDKSNFTCILPNGQKQAMSMALVQLILYQKTYYERNFGAYIKDKKLRKYYESLKHRFYEKPPYTFSFKNQDLNELFGPILVQSKTWVELFKKIHTFTNTCQYMYPWYKDAINHILQHFPIESNTWIIDLQNNNHTPMIPFTSLNIKHTGGKRTRKHPHIQMDEYEEPFDYLMYDEIYNLKYK